MRRIESTRTAEFCNREILEPASAEANMNGKFFAALIVAIVASVYGSGCGDREPLTQSGVGGAGATGGSTSSSSSVSGSGVGGTMGARSCADHGDCNGRDGVPVCNVDVCVGGFCQTFFDALGVFCGDATEICDGRGNCGEWMPAGASECFVVVPLVDVCPFCDDGNPATFDVCVTPDAGPTYCEHATLQDGSACGPNYVVKTGECCPLP
jgi:hypothetical protein